MSNATMDITLLDHPVRSVAWNPAPHGGAECAFLGRTRPEKHPEHGHLVALEYEAYRPMVQRVLQDLADAADARWPCLGIRIHHAVGMVPVGEPSVFISIVTAHRNDAFEACRWIIDTLKMQAPIWKRECWSDGASWAPGHAPDPAALVDT